MPDLNARAGIRYSATQEVTGKDGYTLTFAADDSLRSWWAIVRWNAHYGYWRLVLLTNIRDLFSKVIWRKLWRRFA